MEDDASPPAVPPNAPSGMFTTRLFSEEDDVVLFNKEEDDIPANFGNMVGDGLLVGSFGIRTDDVGNSVGGGVAGGTVGIDDGTLDPDMDGGYDDEGEGEGRSVGNAAKISASDR